MSPKASRTAGSAKGLTAKQLQGQRSREEILDTAERLMSARGYAATSISDLAKASGLPSSSIYWHFGSKSALLDVVMERGARRFFRDVHDSAAVGGPDPRERLTALMRLSADTIRAHPQFLRLFMVLLLGSDGEDVHREVVARVRAEGRKWLVLGLRSAYEPWGDELAGRIAEQLGGYALAVFDGAFIAFEADGDRAADILLEHTVTSIHSLALALRDGDGAHAGTGA